MNKYISPLLLKLFNYTVSVFVCSYLSQIPLRIKPKSLSDWQKKNDNSYVWAWKLGIQRELFDEYLSKSEITQGN